MDGHDTEQNSLQHSDTVQASTQKNYEELITKKKEHLSDIQLAQTSRVACFTVYFLRFRIYIFPNLMTMFFLLSVTLLVNVTSKSKEKRKRACHLDQNEKRAVKHLYRLDHFSFILET